MRFAPTQARARAWTALMAFSRGPFMIYAGQESAARAWPSLFDRAPVEWGEYALTEFLRTLTACTKHEAMRLGDFWVLDDEPLVQAAWANPAGRARAGRSPGALRRVQRRRTSGAGPRADSPTAVTTTWSRGSAWRSSTGGWRCRGLP